MSYLLSLTMILSSRITRSRFQFDQAAQKISRRLREMAFLHKCLPLPSVLNALEDISFYVT